MGAMNCGRCENFQEGDDMMWHLRYGCPATDAWIEAALNDGRPDRVAQARRDLDARSITDGTRVRSAGGRLRPRPSGSNRDSDRRTAGVARFPMSQPGWAAYARSVDLAVQASEPAGASFVQPYDEPPLSPEEEEAIALGGADFGGQSALF